MFDELFPPYCASTVSRWTPTWSKQTDPSGRYENSRDPVLKKISKDTNFFLLVQFQPTLPSMMKQLELSLPVIFSICPIFFVERFKSARN